MFSDIPGLAAVSHYFLIAVLAVLCILLFLCLLRLILGPRVADRLVAVNMMGTIILVCIGILNLLLGENWLLDIALVYALISFLAVVILSQIYIGVNRERNARKLAKRRETDR